MRGETNTATQDPSRKLIPKKVGLFWVIQLLNHTVTVGVIDIHNVVSIDRITLAKRAEDAMQATVVERHDNMPLEADNTGDGHVVERTVRHKDDQERTNYLVR